MYNKKIPESFVGDPSNIAQTFPKFEIKLLCCRCWWLKNWEYARLSFPFWRLYYNFQEGAYIKWQNKTYALKPDCIYLIPPYTDYSSYIGNHKIPLNGCNLTGGCTMVEGTEGLKELTNDGAIIHLFIHFMIDNIEGNYTQGIYEFPINKTEKELINGICESLMHDNCKIDGAAYLKIDALIYNCLCKTAVNLWNMDSYDSRISKITNYISKHLDDPLTNETLASVVFLTPNSLARLFKDEVGITLQNYIRKQRIDYACSLFLHTNLSIEEVASKIGFSNRYHFSRVFRSVTHNTPARYRNNYSL